MHNVEPEGLELVRLDESNPTPLYIQLQQSIEDALERGALKIDCVAPLFDLLD